MLALVYVALLIRRRRLPGPTRLDWPVAALVLTYAAATLFSIDTRVSLEAALLVGFAVVTLYAFHDLEVLTPESMAWGLAGVGVFAGAVVIYHVGDEYLEWLRLMDAVGGLGLRDLMPPTLPRVRGVADNANVIAMALNLCLPFAIVIAGRATERRPRALAAIAVLVVLAGLFFTGSRGAWLGTLAAFGCLGGLHVLQHGSLGAVVARLRGSPRVTGGAVVVLALVALLGGVLLAMRWESRPAFLFRSSVGPRYDAVRAGLSMWQDRPLLGSGPYTYPLLYNTYSGDYPVENIHPHNAYVQVLVDLGIVGALVLLAGGVVLSRAWLRAYREADEERRALLAGCAAALASLAVHGLLDTPNVWDTALVPLGVVLALTLRVTGPPGAAAPRPVVSGWAKLRQPSLAVAGVILALVVAWPVLDWRHGTYDGAIDALSGGRFVDAAVRGRDAAEADTSLAAAQIEAGVAYAVLYVVRSDGGQGRDAQLLQQAERYFRRAIELDPESHIAHANLAIVLRKRSEISSDALLLFDAVAEARRALALARNDGTTAAVAGTVFEFAGLLEEAAGAYSRSVVRDPSLIQSPFWISAGEREGLRLPSGLVPDFSACEWGRASAIYSGFQDEMDALRDFCREEVAQTPGDPRLRAGLAIILHVMGEGDEARREAEEAVRRVPDSPFARTALGIVKAGSGDLPGGRLELARASYLHDPGDPDAALILAYTYEPPDTGNPIVKNLKLETSQTESGEMPGPVLERLKDAWNNAAPMFYDQGRQRYLQGILYYRVRFLRESPTSILVPDEWLKFVSPRVLHMEEALQGRK